MSYEIFVQRFQTGEIDSVSARRVWKLLEEAWYKPPDEDSFVVVTRGKGSADVYGARAGEPIESLMFSRPSGAEIFDLIVEVARAGDMVILAPDLPPCLVDKAQRAELPADLIEKVGEPLIVANGNDLLSLTIQDT